jgi:putative SOS response-associated peptidase YedK
MCNLYTIRTPILSEGMFKPVQWVWQPSEGLHSIRPTDSAPIIVTGADGLQGMQATWGFPSPPQYGSGPVYNTRNLASPFWKPWLGNRALVPVTAFCEHDARKRKHWFGAAGTIFFAGIWGTIAGEPLPRFSIITTESAGVVLPIHPKAMPAILAKAEAAAAWLSGAALEKVHQPDAVIAVEPPQAPAKDAGKAAPTEQPSLF